MKIVCLILTIVCFNHTAEAMIPHARCNQVIYDAIYRQAVQQALNATVMTENDIALKNHAIETLRQLCYGQRSTFEKKNPLKSTFIKTKKDVHYD